MVFCKEISEATQQRFSLLSNISKRERNVVLPTNTPGGYTTEAVSWLDGKPLVRNVDNRLLMCTTVVSIVFFLILAAVLLGSPNLSLWPAFGIFGVVFSAFFIISCLVACCLHYSCFKCFSKQ